MTQHAITIPLMRNPDDSRKMQMKKKNSSSYFWKKIALSFAIIILFVWFCNLSDLSGFQRDIFCPGQLQCSIKTVEVLCVFGKHIYIFKQSYVLKNTFLVSLKWTFIVLLVSSLWKKYEWYNSKTHKHMLVPHPCTTDSGISLVMPDRSSYHSQINQRFYLYILFGSY